MERISSSEDLRGLVSRLVDAKRTRPICVITGTIGDGSVLIDTEVLIDELSRICDFYSVISADLTRELAESLPEGTGVFGGAIRVYRHDFGAYLEPAKSKLFNLRDAKSLERVQARIEEEIWAAANAAGLLNKIERESKPGTAKVLQIMGSRAFVQLESGGLATIHQELIAPDVPLEWFLEKGQELKGVFNSELRLFSPEVSATSKKDLAEVFGIGNVTLGLVKDADRQSARIAVLPAIEFEVLKEEITGNPKDVISGYLDVGDVVPVRIYRNPEGKIRLRMDDIDDDEAVLESLPIIPGGMPWLLEGRNLTQENLEPETGPISVLVESEPDELEPLTDAPEQQRPVPRPGMQPAVSPSLTGTFVGSKGVSELGQENKAMAETIRQLKAEKQRLRDERLAANMELIEIKNQLRERNAELAELRSDMSELRKAKRAQLSGKSTTYSRRDRFRSDVDWFNEELRRAWIGRYTPQEREDSYPLKIEEVSYSSEFFPSISRDQLDEDELRKTVRVMVDLISGRNAVEHKHKVHELFEGLGGPQKSRSDGALCWRVRIESGTPQAKRLHYWQLRDGSIEFGWVANHDDDL